MSNILREKIARAIDPTLGAENDWAAQSADRILEIPEIAEALQHQQIATEFRHHDSADSAQYSRPFDAWDGGAKVLGAIKEVLSCNGPIETAMERGEAALRDLCGAAPLNLGHSIKVR